MDSNRDAACSPEDHALLTRQNTPHVMRYRYAKCGVFVMVCSAENQSIPIADSSRPRSSLRTAVVVTDNSVLHPRVSSCANPPFLPLKYTPHTPRAPARPAWPALGPVTLTDEFSCMCVYACTLAHTHTDTPTQIQGTKTEASACTSHVLREKAWESRHRSCEGPRTTPPPPSRPLSPRRSARPSITTRCWPPDPARRRRAEADAWRRRRRQQRRSVQSCVEERAGGA